MYDVIAVYRERNTYKQLNECTDMLIKDGEYGEKESTERSFHYFSKCRVFVYDSDWRLFTVWIWIACV